MTPAPIDEPTLGEVLRGLTELKREFISLSEQIRQFEATAAKTYVRQDVYRAERQAMEANVSDVRTDVTAVATSTDARFAKIETERETERTNAEVQRRADAAARRQQWTAIGTCAVMALIALAALVVNVIQG